MALGGVDMNVFELFNNILRKAWLRIEIKMADFITVFGHNFKSLVWKYKPRVFFQILILFLFSTQIVRQRLEEGGIPHQEQVWRLN